MIFTYDPEVDAAYILLVDRVGVGGVAGSEGFVETPNGESQILLDFDHEGRLLGVETLVASEGFPQGVLASAADLGRYTWGMFYDHLGLDDLEMREFFGGDQGVEAMRREHGGPEVSDYVVPEPDLEMFWDEGEDTVYLQVGRELEDGVAVVGVGPIVCGRRGSKVFLDFDAGGFLVGVEVLGARRGLPAEVLRAAELRPGAAGRRRAAKYRRRKAKIV